MGCLPALESKTSLYIFERRFLPDISPYLGPELQDLMQKYLSGLKVSEASCGTTTVFTIAGHSEYLNPAVVHLAFRELIDEQSTSKEMELGNVELVESTTVMTYTVQRYSKNPQYRRLADPSNKLHVVQRSTVLMGSARSGCVRFRLDPILEINLGPQ